MGASCSNSNQIVQETKVASKPKNLRIQTDLQPNSRE